MLIRTFVSVSYSTIPCEYPRLRLRLKRPPKLTLPRVKHAVRLLPMKATFACLAEAVKEVTRSPRVKKAAVELTEAAAGAPISRRTTPDFCQTLAGYD